MICRHQTDIERKDLNAGEQEMRRHMFEMDARGLEVCRCCWQPQQDAARRPRERPRRLGKSATVKLLVCC